MSGDPGTTSEIAASAHDRPMAAWKSPRAWAFLLVTTVVGVALDLWSKAAAFERIADAPVVIRREDVLAGGPLYRLVPAHDPVVVAPNLLELTLVLNPGAVFGIGAGKRWFFVIFTGAAIGFALWMFARWTRAKDRIAHIGIALLLAGGLGNLYDRLAFACVRDFLHPLPRVKLPFGWSYPWGSGSAARELWPYVSNVADALLIVGIAILVLRTWRHGGAEHPDLRVKHR